jgi:hypothetical protein
MPTCPLDENGFATVALTDLCDGTATGFPYPCMVSPADLLKGLQCDEVTTDHDGFTRTVGCGYETVELHAYESRTTFDLETEYAATYDSTTGKLTGLVVKQPSQFGTCSSYAYKAGDLPPDCPSATTYACHRIPTGNASDAAYAGCRSLYEPGCSACCVSSDANSCGVRSLDRGFDELKTACPCACKPCARCSIEQELAIRIVVPHPECNCSLPPMGGTCGSWCNYVMNKDPSCPGL